jgi:NAD(P)-dependent dehydrogenase (short-subunit alcohol dehydrogenase family)/3-hydroxymyristoyl/3-hydroxydecanoyl-(acyl carrier protein) dehydratase
MPEQQPRELSAAEVSGLIPHEYPFRFIDGATVLEPGRRASAKMTDLTHPDFNWLTSSHFPDAPMVPGAIMAEAMAEVLGVAAASSDNQEYSGMMGVYRGIQGMKFRRMVRPADTATGDVTLEAELTDFKSRYKLGVGKVRTLVGDKVAAEGIISFALVDREQFMTAVTPDAKPELGEKEFEGRIVLIVGGSRGIGAEVARLAALHGAKRVLINSRIQSQDEAHRLMEENEGINAYIPGDITVPGSAEEIINTAFDSAGRLDDVIISAGTRDDGIFTKMTDEQIRRIMETNFLGPAFVAREAIKAMRKQRPRGGTITFISSLAARGSVGQANYSASKGAEDSLTMTLAKEYESSGIRVNAVAPGLVGTSLIASLTDSQKASLLALTRSKRVLPPIEVAGKILYLASPRRKASVTGWVVPLHG